MACSLARDRFAEVLGAIVLGAIGAGVVLLAGLLAGAGLAGAGLAGVALAAGFFLFWRGSKGKGCRGGGEEAIGKFK